MFSPTCWVKGDSTVTLQLEYNGNVSYRGSSDSSPSGRRVTRTGAGEVFDTEREEKKDSLSFFLPIQTCAPLWRGERRLETSQCLGYLQVVAVTDVLFGRRGGGGGGFKS